MKDKLTQHAELTVAHLERFFARRGMTTGLKQWEQELLFSAYEALEIPTKDRKFGLAKIKTIGDIQRKHFY